MKKNLLVLSLIAGILFFTAPAIFAAQSSRGERPVGPLFVVETDEETARESLDRISGRHDAGFSSPDQTYQSVNHASADPFRD